MIVVRDFLYEVLILKWEDDIISGMMAWYVI